LIHAVNREIVLEWRYGGELVEQQAKLRAVGLRAAGDFAEHFRAASFGELAHLGDLSGDSA
jgi:hypothetical protein